jgi:hypothetical protein
MINFFSVELNSSITNCISFIFYKRHILYIVLYMLYDMIIYDTIAVYINSLVDNKTNF